MKLYIGINKDSWLEKIWSENYGNDSAKLIRTIIDDRAFENVDSYFFSRFGLSPLLTARMKREFNSNAAFASTHLQRCKEIVVLLKQLQ
jgi:hypothetical protein